MSDTHIDVIVPGNHLMTGLLGHRDELLKQIGPRLESALRASDTVARFGGDEFAVLIPDLTLPWLAGDVAGRMAASLEEPFVIQGLAIDVEPSIGIALYPSGSQPWNGTSGIWTRKAIAKHMKIQICEVCDNGCACRKEKAKSIGVPDWLETSTPVAIAATSIRNEPTSV